MARVRSGDHEAAGRLVELSYPELRRIAAAGMRAECPDDTLQPTAVVHQLCLELVKVRALRPFTMPSALRGTRSFEGLTRDGIAHEVGCGTATVSRHWSFA
jgi:hypothetical protein